MFELKNIYFKRGAQSILENLSFDIKDGILTSLIGPSGAGKSTILGLLTGRIQPDSGEVYFDGSLLNELKQEKLLELRKKMSIMFQSGALFTDLSVFDNVAFPIEEILTIKKAEREKKVLEILASLNLLDAKDKFPSQLSGGMKYRLAFAKTIATDPEVIMFDEPFVGQDPLIKALMIQLINDLKRQGKTIILVSHDIKEALSVSDRTLFLYNKNILFDGTPQNLRKSDEFIIKEFLQEELINV